jgi:uncharacterized protein YdeI (YjbR/CyaY-like superfamily)
VEALEGRRPDLPADRRPARPRLAHARRRAAVGGARPLEGRYLKPRFFASAADFRRWLEENHAAAGELWIGFWKAHSGRKGLTYEEAVEEALCFGWIDGLVKRYDEHAYMQRFTPRRAKSIWSLINIAKVEDLKKRGRMHAAGLAAFASRDPARSGLYSSENRDVKLDPAMQKAFRARKRAWAFFEAQPPGYKRLMLHWVMSAKREETRARRLAQLMAASAKGERIPLT